MTLLSALERNYVHSKLAVSVNVDNAVGGSVLASRRINRTGIHYVNSVGKLGSVHMGMTVKRYFAVAAFRCVDKLLKAVLYSVLVTVNAEKTETACLNNSLVLVFGEVSLALYEIKLFLGEKIGNIYKFMLAVAEVNKNVGVKISLDNSLILLKLLMSISYNNNLHTKPLIIFLPIRTEMPVMLRFIIQQHYFNILYHITHI